jgi:Cu(I)/Ag(I) efflux system membrane fusion protein
MNKKIVTIVLAALVLGVALGYWLSPSPTKELAEVQERKPLYYRNPMDPGITSATPAKGSMGMDYIPVYAEPRTMEAAGTVIIDPVVVQNIGVRTKTVVRKDISRTIRAVGRVDVNEEKITRLHPKVEGWVEEIFVETTGDLVTADDILLGVYSPKLVSSQQEYLLALAGRNLLGESSIEEVRQGADQLVQSARERLQFFDVPEHQIRELEETRVVKRSLHIHSPSGGTVIHVGVRKGQFITPKTELYQITDLSEVWVYIDVYDYELPWVMVGDKVELTLASIPGEVFTGVLSYIYPYAEKNTRTTKLRVVFDNPDYRLRPEMFADALIHANPRTNVLVIPTEAIVRSGSDTQVFVVRGKGKFEPRTVTLGISSGKETAVIKGVTEGEQIVTSAQFLIDSESKLNEATAKMLEAIGGDKMQSQEKVKESMEHQDHD